MTKVVVRFAMGFGITAAACAYVVALASLFDFAGFLVAVFTLAGGAMAATAPMDRP